jgi:hypothetical protein
MRISDSASDLPLHRHASSAAAVLRPSLLDLTHWFFLRGLALVYGIAFTSFWTQAEGLVGSQGILPAEQLLRAVAGRFGLERFWLLPSLFWLGASDAALHVVCAAGVGVSMLALLNIAPAPAFGCLWALYLSILRIGGDFLSVQSLPHDESRHKARRACVVESGAARGLQPDVDAALTRR